MSQISHKLLIGLLSVAVMAGTLFSQTLGVRAETAEERIALHREMEVQSNLIEGWPEGPIVSAESAILMEAESGTILYAKNIHKQEYPASTTKILTTLLATELCQLDEIVTFSHDAVFDNPPGSSGIAMDVGQELTMEQCLNAILIRSANEVAFAVAEHITGTADWSVFADIMNERAKELGALNTHFANPNGLPDENHYTTAYDMAMIGRGFFANKMLCDISITRRMEIPASDKLPEAKIEISSMQIIPGGKYAYEYLVGCKTGYTVAARSSLVSCAEKDGLKLICVVMRDESPLQYEDTISLFNYGFGNFRKYNVSQTEKKYDVTFSDTVYSVNDVFGSSKPLLTLNKDDCIILPKSAEIGDTESTISYDTPDPGQAAVISYTYKGVDVGRVRLLFAADDNIPYEFDAVPEDALTEVTGNGVVVAQTAAPGEEETDSFPLTSVLLIAGIAAVALILLFLLLRLRAGRNYHTFTPKSNRRTWRRRRRRGFFRRRNKFRDYDF